jgi:hypothetical protein
MRLLLGDPLRELSFVVTQRILTRQLKNQRLFNDLSVLSLWLGQRQKCEHRFLLDLLRDGITQSTTMPQFLDASQS